LERSLDKLSVTYQQIHPIAEGRRKKGSSAADSVTDVTRYDLDVEENKEKEEAIKSIVSAINNV